MSVGEAAMTRRIATCRGLLLQRFRDFAIARLDLVEQPDILDGDHSLVGEGLDQLDLLCRERLHLRARQDKHAEGLTLAQQWNAKNGSIAAQLLVAEGL